MFDLAFLGTIPDLQVSSLHVQNLTCNGIDEGKITVGTNGGRYASVTYELTNTSTNVLYNKNSTTANASVSFDKLLAGAYQLEVDDGCSPKIIKTITVIRLNF